MNPNRPTNSAREVLQIPSFERFMNRNNDDEGSRDRFKLQFNCGQYFGSWIPWKVCLMKSEQTPEDLFAMVELDNATPFANKCVKAKFRFQLMAGTKILEPCTSSSGMGTIFMTKFSVSNVEKAAAENKGRLSLHLDIEVVDLTTLSKIVTHKRKYGNKVVADIVSAYQFGVGTDVTLTCRESKGSQTKITRSAHKAVLMSRSSVFAALFGPNSQAIEAKTSVLDFPDLTEKGMDLILWFLYTDLLKVDWIANVEEVVEFMAKYQLTDLKSYLDKNLVSECTLGNSSLLYSLALNYGMNQARDEIRNFVFN